LYCYDAYRLLGVIQNEVNAKDCYSELEIKSGFYVLKPNIILLFRFDVYLPAFHISKKKFIPSIKLID